jgi:hypothetical protein
MTTIDDLRQRLEDRFLEPAVEQTPTVPLAADMTSSATTFSILQDVLSIDELSLIGPGALFEIGSELVRIESFNQSTWEITCRRGVRGTTAVAHTAAADELRFPTRWTRKSQHESLSDSINALWPPLFVIEEQRATIQTAGYLPLPLDTIRIQSVKYQTSERRWEPVGAALFKTHPTDNTVASVQIDPLPYQSALCVVRYGRKIVAPTTVDTDIPLLPSGWERIILVDAAAELLSGVDIDAVTQEIMTEQIRLEGFPVKSAMSISQSLVRYREYLIEQAQTGLASEEPKKVHRRAVSWGS